MSNPQKITIDDTVYVREDSLQKVEPVDGSHVLVRGNRSGVFFGVLNERNGTEVVLKNCIRIWYWDGAASLSQLSISGTSKPTKCKFPQAVTEIVILDAIEVIPCTADAIKSIKGVKSWVA